MASFGQVRRWFEGLIADRSAPISTSVNITTTAALQGNYLRVGVSTISATGAYAPATHGGFVRCDATAGAVAITLPTASSWTGLQVTFEKIDAEANNVTVATVEGGTVTLTGVNDSVTVISDGVVWRNIGSST
jgi:hypothetical protein